MVQCSTCLIAVIVRRKVRVAQLGRILSAAARSPWSWPIVPLLTVVAVGQWGNAIAAAAVAGAFCAIGLSIAIGLALVGRPTSPRNASRTQSDDGAPNARPPSASRAGPSSGADAQAHAGNPSRAADLRGARLTNTTLVRADLRHADLRGAILAGADLSDADLTDARLGPLDGDEPDESA
jgi:hypothetical protein